MFSNRSCVLIQPHFDTCQASMTYLLVGTFLFKRTCIKHSRPYALTWSRSGHVTWTEKQNSTVIRHWERGNPQWVQNVTSQVAQAWPDPDQADPQKNIENQIIWTDLLKPRKKCVQIDQRFCVVSNGLNGWGIEITLHATNRGLIRHYPPP